MPSPNQHAGTSTHASVDRGLGQPCTVNVVLSRRGNTSNQVTWINVFQVNIHPTRRKKFVDPFFKKKANVPLPMSARSVRTFRAFLQQVLSLSLSNNNHCAIPTTDSVPQ